METQRGDRASTKRLAARFAGHTVDRTSIAQGQRSRDEIRDSAEAHEPPRMANR